MLFQKTFQFRNWELWAPEIHAAAKDFFTSFRLYPNLMVANPFSYSKINEAANQGQPSEEYTGILGFNAKDYKIEFLVDEKMQDGIYHLLYDRNA